MKLVLDEQHIEVNESGDTPLRTVVEKLSEQLKDQNRVISEIYLDGKAMGGWDDPELSSTQINSCKHLRIISSEPRALAREVLREVVKYMPRIQKALIDTAVKIQSRQEEEAMQLLEQVTTTWLELYQALQSSLSVTGVDAAAVTVEGKTFGQLNEEIQGYLDQVSQMVQEQQMLELSDILEYELAPRIPALEEAIFRIIAEADRPMN